MSSDYYSTLGVSKNASKSEIKSAYKKLAKQFHPDVNKDPNSQDKFKEVSRAYQVLSDDDKRAAYDRMGHSNFEQARKTGGSSGFNQQYNVNWEDLFGGGYNGGGGTGFRDPLDIFEELFGRQSGQPRRQRDLTGEDLQVIITLEFNEAVHGADHEIEYNAYNSCDACDGTGSANKSKTSKTCQQCNGAGQVRQQSAFFGASFSQVTVCPVCKGSGELIENPCTKCNGQGRVQKKQRTTIKIPAGVDTQTRIRYTGKGNAGVRGQQNGDLYVIFKVKPHPHFERHGQDILLGINITPPQAALGTQVKIPTIYNEKTLKIPAGTQPGKRLKIKDAGVPYINSERKGDQIVTIHVEIPTKLSKAEKELYEKLLDSESRPKSFIEKIFN